MSERKYRNLKAEVVDDLNKLFMKLENVYDEQLDEEHSAGEVSAQDFVQNLYDNIAKLIDSKDGNMTTDDYYSSANC